MLLETGYLLGVSASTKRACLRLVAKDTREGRFWVTPTPIPITFLWFCRYHKPLLRFTHVPNVSPRISAPSLPKTNKVCHCLGKPSSHMNELGCHVSWREPRGDEEAGCTPMWGCTPMKPFINIKGGYDLSDGNLNVVAKYVNVFGHHFPYTSVLIKEDIVSRPQVLE